MMKHLTLLAVAAFAVCASATAQNRVKTLSTYSQNLNVEQLQTSETPVQLTRTLFAGYNTLCLPFSLTAEQLQTAARDLRVERLSAIHQEGAVLNLYFLECTENGIEAGVPYIVFSPTTQTLRARTTEAQAISSALLPVTLEDAQGNRVTFGSSWQSLPGSDNRYGIPAKQDTELLASILIRTSADQMFLPTRCGVTWEQQSATATDIQVKHAASIGELATAIQAVEGKTGSAAVVYDLQGRRTTTSSRGIYVIDGKKTVVK
ncbi:MAG: hypothetical protein IJ767_03535 [Bacteroidaceae bacterium]|nr:hypothetical protein [Bacteroidaceae bacterium]MBR1800550.1 hypothetical protein [Bacteroidaceae bacterium]